jgi:cytochrome bd-type quinol oxidase subunit 1
LSILFFWYAHQELYLTIGFINAVGVFQTYYQENQLSDYTAFQIGWLSSFLIFFMNMGVVSGISWANVRELLWDHYSISSVLGGYC